MEKPKFNNRPNKYDGRGYFVSRAISIDGVVLAIKPEGMYVLIGKRSMKMRDEAGKFCVPCGYLDWDETCYEGMTREVYEETSFYLPYYKKYLLFDNNKQPFLIKDDPKSPRQNVTMVYINVYNFTSEMNEDESFVCKETELVKWLPTFSPNNLVWAFNHDDMIREAIVYYREHRKNEKDG